jgi:hypothetical protein
MNLPIIAPIPQQSPALTSRLQPPPPLQNVDSNSLMVAEEYEHQVKRMRPYSNHDDVNNAAVNRINKYNNAYVIFVSHEDYYY